VTGRAPLTPVAGADDARWYTVEEVGHGTAVPRAATALATQLGLPQARIDGLAILATELTSNLYKHAREGTVLVRSLRLGPVAGVELVAVDAGPGMTDVAASSRDGHSTAGTLGIGLSAIERAATSWDVYSLPGRGTVTAIQVWPDGVPRPAWVQGIARPITGERSNGDGFAARVLDGRGQVVVCDGLGHGPLAEAATQAALRAFDTAPAAGPATVVEHLHRALRGTRGAAIMVAELDPVGATVLCAGLGNIAGAIVAPGYRRQLVTVPGIAGTQARGLREFSYPFPAEGALVLHSDGVTGRWTLDEYPGLLTRTPIAIAATLLRDYGIRRDDASVLVATAGSGGADG